MSRAEPSDTSGVKRRSVKVIKSRLEDIVVGDVVNRQPDAEMGWFTVHAISTLFNGHLQLADESEQLTVSGDHKDMVGLQLVEEVELDDRGVLAPPAPAVVATPMAHAATEPVAPPIMATPGRPAGPGPGPARTSEGPVDDATEAAAAAQVATQTGVPTEVNLALVAELLEDLDVGDAPDVTSTVAPRSPEAAAPVPMPEGAVAVFGDTLPDSPSYKNPVVVPEGTQLPRRSRAA